MSGVCSVFGTFEITSKPTNAARARIVSDVRMSIPDWPLTSGGGGADRLLGALVHDLAIARDAGAGDHGVLEVELQRSLVADHQLEQRGDVAGVELRRVVGHVAGQVQRRGD